jgi:hypothetical protein
MLNKLLNVLGTARRALSSELTLIRAGLTGLALHDQALAERAAHFVASGDDVAVLPALAALNGAPGAALGQPGGLGWTNYYGQHAADIEAARKTSRTARASLYQRAVNEPAYVAMLVRLGKVLAAADQLQTLNRTLASIPDWLQYLLNDALWGTLSSNGQDHSAAQLPGWNVTLLAALLADDGQDLPVLPIVFERRELSIYFQDRAYGALLAPGALDDYLLAHPQQVEATAQMLSAGSRVMLLKRLASNPALLDAFAQLVIGLAVGDSKTVRATAAPLLDAIDQATARASLNALLTGGRGEERANAADLLVRTQGDAARPLLEAALAAETGKTVQQAIQAALSRLATAADAGELQLPEPPPLPPAPDQVLGDDALDLLLDNRVQLLERYRVGAEQEVENNRTSKYTPTYRQDAYTRYGKLGEGMLRDAVRALNGQGGDKARAMLANGEVRTTLEFGGRLEARPDFGLPQVLRRVLGSGYTHWATWNQTTFQNWLLRQDPQQVDLRQLAALVTDYGGDARRFGLDCLRLTGDTAPHRLLPADRVWPLFAAQPELLDVGLGLAPSNIERFEPNLACALEVLATFPVIPPRWVPPVMELALGEGKTYRAAAQQAMGRMPDIGKRVADALQSGKQELRIEAARWLAALDYRDGIGALQTALAKETRETASAAMLTALEQLGVDLSSHLAPAKLLAQAQKGLKGKPPASMAWLDLTTLPPCTWADGTPVDADIIRWWVILACKLKEPAGNALLERYLGLLAPASTATLGAFLLHQWVERDTRHPSLDECNAFAQAGADLRLQQYQDSARRWPQYYEAQGKLSAEQVYEELKREKMGEYLGTAINEKGLLALVSGTPGHVLVSVIQHYMRDHYQRRAQVEALIEAACVSNDASVIQFALGIARRYRTASVQEKARVLVQRIADRNGWTPDQLADRTVPTGGLDDSGRLALQYGSRAYTITLDAAMKPVLRNEEGKIVAALPAARQNDDADSIKEAKQQFAACKKEVKQVVDMQTGRLYEAMCAGRRWPAAEWRQYLQQHPVVGRLVQQLVWEEVRVDDAGATTTRCFRPTEDGSLIDASDDDVELDDSATIRLTHRALVDDEQAAAWTAHFKDYKLTPLFAQMSRPLPAQTGGDAIADRLGWISDAFTLRGAFAKRGYQRSGAEDGGTFFEYHKEFATSGLLVAIEFTGNTLPEENIPAALKTLTFRRRGTHRYGYQTLALAEVPPVLLAEAYGDYLAIAAACTGFDPEWEKKSPW